MSRRHLSRRTVLRGAGVAIALPTLAAMLDANGTAYAQGGALPKRFGIFFWGLGCKPDRWIPAKTGQGDAWELSQELAPLAKVKEHLTVVTGTVNPSNGHHGCPAVMLSGAPSTGGGSPATTMTRRTIDLDFADKLAAGARYRTMELGVSSEREMREGTTISYISHNGPHNFNPPEFSPLKVFQRLFSDGAPKPMQPAASAAPAGPDPMIELHKSVLDSVVRDAQKLEMRLGREDRARIDQHLTSIRELEQRLTSPTGGAAACAQPASPPSTALDPMAGRQGDWVTPVNDAMAELAALAFACDQTRVLTYLHSGEVERTLYTWLGAKSNAHGFSHNEAAPQPVMHAITTFKMGHLATLGEKLKAIPEGAGTLLDNCAILCCTGNSDPQRHSEDEVPLLVLGRGGGLRGNLHHRSTTGESPLKVHLTLLKAFGIAATSYGAGGYEVNQTMDAILA